MFKKKLVDRIKDRIKVLRGEFQKNNQQIVLMEKQKNALIQKGISIKGGIIELEEAIK